MKIHGSVFGIGCRDGKGARVDFARQGYCALRKPAYEGVFAKRRGAARRALWRDLCEAYQGRRTLPRFGT
jgi:hypothetical protein